MKRWMWLVILFAVIAGLAACNAESPEDGSVEPSGPALIMFYTDN